MASLADALRDIRLRDTEGTEQRLGALWEGTGAVLVFLRHYGWIFAREQAAQLRHLEPRIAESGARLAAIGLGDRNHARAFRAETGIEFPLLVDDERRAYRAVGLAKGSVLHLLRLDNVASRARARSGGHRQKGLGKDPFQLGGAVVIAADGRELLVHRARTFGDLVRPEALLDALDAL